MWRKQEESKASGVASDPIFSPSPEQPRSLSPQPIEPGSAAGNVTKSLRIKGQITGTDDLFIDGEVEGRIHLKAGTVTVGPNGRVNADIEAPQITVRGKVKGTLHGSERVWIARSGQANSEVFTRSIVIEEGAIFKGRIEVVHTQEKPGSRAVTGGSSPEALRPVPVVAKEPQP